MPIIYPPICRGVTSGALRQINQRGHTTANGGLYHPQFVKNMTRAIEGAYFDKTEPAGIYMSTLEQTKTQLEENTSAIQESGRRLVDAAKDASKQMADVTGRFRAGTEHLGTAIDKLMKVAGRADFEKTVRLTESLVSSLERLAVLEEKGLLDKVMKAMQSA